MKHNKYNSDFIEIYHFGKAEIIRISDIKHVYFMGPENKAIAIEWERVDGIQQYIENYPDMIQAAQRFNQLESILLFKTYRSYPTLDMPNDDPN